MEEAESYLALGSNLGDRLGYLKDGVESVSRIPGVTAVKLSGVYETEPVGVTDQPLFLNMAMQIRTVLEPDELLKVLKGVEEKLGRVHRERWREREIDIDIIFYADRRIVSDHLTIPHGSAHLRRFVLEPLSEIASAFEHPAFHKTVKQLLDACPDTSGVHRLQEFARPVS